MHRCLRIDEIVRRVARQVEHRTDGLHLALVCRSFLGPALDALWHTLPGLAPLVLCLGAEVQVFPPGDLPCLLLVDTPTASQWARFAYYAHRVQVLFVDEPRTSAVVHPSCYDALCYQYPQRDALPSLHSLICEHTPFPTHVTNLVGPSLRTLAWTVTQWPTVVDIVAAFQQLTAMCLPLTALRIDTQGIGGVERAVVELIHSLPCLEEFECYGHTPAGAIAHLAASPTLWRLSCTIGDLVDWEDVLARLQNQSAPAFPTLSSLVVSIPEERAELASQLLGTIQLGELLALVVRFTPCLSSGRSGERGSPASDDTGDGAGANAAIWQPILTSASRFRGLRHLIVEQPWPGHSGSPAVLREAYVRPLLHLRALRVLRMQAALAVPPAVLADMAQAWPALEELYTLPNYADPSARFTVQDLVPFAWHCPRLRVLALHVCGTRPALAEFLRILDYAVEVPEPALRVLTMHTSTVGSADVLELAAFLARLFPAVQVLSSDAGLDEGRRIGDEINGLLSMYHA